MEYTIMIIILCLGCFISTIIPVMWWFMVTFLGWLLLQDYDPLVLSFFATISAIAGTTLIWFSDQYIRTQWTGFLTWIRGQCQRHRTWAYTHIYEKQYVSDKRKEKKDAFHNSFQKAHHMWRVMLVSAYTFQSPLPDIIIIGYLRHKISFPMFVCAVVAGKLFTYVPFIYGIDIVDDIILQYISE